MSARAAESRQWGLRGLRGRQARAAATELQRPFPTLHGVERHRPSGAPATADIDVARLAFERALRVGDAAAAAAIYTDDATLLAPAADVLHGRPAIQRFWQTGVDTGIQHVDLVVLDLQQRGEVAFEVGEYALHVAPESGATVVDRGRYLIVHRVEADGRWRRAAEMFSPDQPPSHAPG